MDLDLTPTKSADETELDTPPHTHTPAIKNHHRPAAFKECMKNHAANIGGHAVDGCGEYMATPSTVATDPISLICAACGCHRNFHRRDPESPTAAMTPPFLNFRRPGHAQGNRITSSPSPSFQYGPQSHVLLALGNKAERHQESATPTAENLLGRKRSRTKFSQEQKERMHSFSEKLGWKMQRSDEATVAEFCRDVGVARGVLKVWMHNNKNTVGGRKLESVIVGESRKSDDESGGGLHFHHSNNNGSCSSP